MRGVKEKWLLDDQIRHNKRATVWLFLVVFLILWALVMAVGFILNVTPVVTGLFALIFGVVYIALAGGFSVEAILHSARAKPADPRNPLHRRLLHTVEEMQIAAGIPMPKVYVTPSKDINAFATGRKPEEGVIAVTEGALEQLSREELQGVIAHEMSHIKNQDIRVQTYAIALIGIIAMIAEMVWWGLIFGGGRGGRRDMSPQVMIVLFVISLALIILAPLLSRLVYMAISRRREYLADASGAHMTRNPEGLAAALEKISGTEPTESHKGDRTVASLYLANPLKRVRRESMWATHPPIQERIERLRRM